VKRVALVAAALVFVAAVPLLVVAFSGDDGAGAESETDGSTAPPATAPVTRRDLEERESLDGTLGYPAGREVALGGQGGTITALAAEGTVVDRGGSLGEVDGEPVTLLFGDRPAWRSLGEGADTSAGADVRQLEENLIALGYGTAAALGPNETWSQATTAAVKRWQDANGAETTGVVDLGDVVFAAGPVRVGSHLVDVGSPAGSPALALTGLDREVTLDLDANRQGLLAVGQAVDVELPSGEVVPGAVRSIASVVDPPDPSTGGGATVAVVIGLDDPASAGSLDQAPVDVDVVRVAAADALTVPVDALLALAEGGYAVERPDGTLVGVELGAFADGFVEVRPTTGALEEGDDVVVPA
jgi:hypothetical protein